MDARYERFYCAILKVEDLPQELIDEHAEWDLLVKAGNKLGYSWTMGDLVTIAKRALNIKIDQERNVTFTPCRKPAVQIKANGTDWEKVAKGNYVQLLGRKPQTPGGEVPVGKFLGIAERGRLKIDVTPEGTETAKDLLRSDVKLMEPNE